MKTLREMSMAYPRSGPGRPSTWANLIRAAWRCAFEERLSRSGLGAQVLRGSGPPVLRSCGAQVLSGSKSCRAADLRHAARAGVDRGDPRWGLRELSGLPSRAEQPGGPPDPVVRCNHRATEMAVFLLPVAPCRALVASPLQTRSSHQFLIRSAPLLYVQACCGPHCCSHGPCGATRSGSGSSTLPSIARRTVLVARGVAYTQTGG